MLKWNGIVLDDYTTLNVKDRLPRKFQAAIFVVMGTLGRNCFDSSDWNSTTVTFGANLNLL
jgi:hypothetical protein